MLHITESQLKSEMKSIVSLLVGEDYQTIKDQNLLPLVDISNLIGRIRQYPGLMTIPSDDMFENLEFIEFLVTDDNFFFQADLKLWFDDRESDLMTQFISS
ncbi:MAG: DUF7668 domain-containing protein [Deinococcus sp.]